MTLTASGAVTDVTREELVVAVQDMRAALRAALRCASGPVPDWAGAAKELDKVNELSCELWQGCMREGWRRYGDR